MESVTCGEEPIGINEKLCVDCKTSKTPLWRSGPAGPKSLCNACGIRFRKKRSPAPSDKKREKQAPSCPSPLPSPSSSSCSTSAAAHTVSFRNREDVEDAGMRKNLRVKLVAVGKEVVVLQRRRSRMMKKVKGDRIEKEYKKLGEVEQAAFLLMSMSCGGRFFGNYPWMDLY